MIGKCQKCSGDHRTDQCEAEHAFIPAPFDTEDFAYPPDICSKCGEDRDHRLHKVKKKKPIRDQVYVLREFRLTGPVYDIVTPVIDEKGFHRQWKSLVTNNVIIAGEEDNYAELPTDWVGIILEGI